MRTAAALCSLMPVLVVVTACNGEDTKDDSVVLPAHCNPLSTDHCMLPWPSTFYLQADAATKTGYRLHYPSEAMPKNRDGKPLDPTRYGFLDGFSVGSQLVVYFKEGIGEQGLPGFDSIAASITDQSPIWIIEHTTGERVPYFAELDANIKSNEVAALIIRPQVPLKFNSRYVVVLRSTLRDGQGQPLQPPEPFLRLREGRDTSNPALEGERKRLEEVLSFLDQQKIDRDDVVLAWDFHTASHEAVTGNVTGMVEEALGKLPSGGPSYTITDTNDAPGDPNLLRTIEGEMEVPSYLASDDRDAWLKLDAQGRPVYRGAQKFPFYARIPRCAEQAVGPLPVLIFGPGLFSDPKGESLKEYHTQLVEELCMVEVTAQWRGLSNVDAAAVGAQVMIDFSNLPRVTDQLQQAHVNFQVLTELARGPLMSDAALQVGGKPVADGKTIYYLGISNGGIQGIAFAALNKHIERFAYHVSAGWWSLMIQRSSDFQLLALMMEKIYPSATDRALLVSLTQHLWDYTDPICYARHLLGTPLPGRSKKRVVMQESKYDDQVPNLATRTVARTIGLDQLSPEVEKIYGLSQKPGPLESGIAQWRTDPPVQPTGKNIPAPKPADELSAHNRPRRMASFRAQLKAFFKPDGKLVQTCDGVCDPE
jgi:hypothetical protein